MPTSIVTICENNCVKEIYAFSTVEGAEARFQQEIRDRGVEPTDVNMDNGYFNHEDGQTICLSTNVPQD